MSQVYFTFKYCILFDKIAKNFFNGNFFTNKIYLTFYLCYLSWYYFEYE